MNDLPNLIGTKLNARFQEARSGAQYELTIPGQDCWAALVGSEEMPAEEALRWAKLLANAPRMEQALQAILQLARTADVLPLPKIAMKMYETARDVLPPSPDEEKAAREEYEMALRAYEEAHAIWMDTQVCGRAGQEARLKKEAAALVYSDAVKRFTEFQQGARRTEGSAVNPIQKSR